MIIQLFMILATVAAEEFYGGKYSKVEEITDANFQQKVLDSEEMWVIEFYAPWCGHC